MANERLSLVLPEALGENLSIDWLVADNSKVEIGDPIAIAEKEGEKYIAFAPSEGWLQRTADAPVLVAKLGLLLAYLALSPVKSGKSKDKGILMPDPQEVYMAKLRDVVKEAVKDDFAAVNKRIDSLETRFEKRMSSVENSLNAIKKHLGVK